MENIDYLLDWIREKLLFLKYGEISICLIVHDGKIVKCEKTVVEKEKTENN